MFFEVFLPVEDVLQLRREKENDDELGITLRRRVCHGAGVYG